MRAVVQLPACASAPLLSTPPQCGDPDAHPAPRRPQVEQMAQAAERASFIKGLLSADFPRLRGLLLAMWLKVRRDSDAGRAGAVGEGERAELLAALEPLQAQHVARAATRITESVNTLFAAKAAGGPVGPQPADVAALVKIVNGAAQSSRTEPELAALVARRAAGALALFVGRCGEATRDDAEARALGDSVTGVQARNLAVYAAAAQLRAALDTIEGGLRKGGAGEAAQVWVQLRDDVAACASRAAAPLFDALGAAVGDACSLLHAAPLQASGPASPAPGAPDDDGAAPAPPYVRHTTALVESFLARSPPPPPPPLLSLSLSLSLSLVESFLARSPRTPERGARPVRSRRSGPGRGVRVR